MPKGYEIREPYEKERAELFKVFYACFPKHTAIFEKLEHGKRPLNDYLYGYEPLVMLVDGHIVANVSLIRYRIYLNGKVVPVGGIGGVVTHPDYQRRGYAKILLQERLRNMQEENTHISVLLTEIPWAYESLGWKIVPQDYLVIDITEQKDNKVDPNISVTEEIGPVRSIIELYNKIAPSLNGAIKREPAYWEDYYFKGITGFIGSGDLFLLYRDDSELLGYARLHNEKNQILLAEIMAKEWNSDILEKIFKSAMKLTYDKGYHQLVLGLQENHPLREQIIELGLKPTAERPEGIREFCMVNLVEESSNEGKYSKRLHWCYHDKF